MHAKTLLPIGALFLSSLSILAQDKVSLFLQDEIKSGRKYEQIDILVIAKNQVDAYAVIAAEGLEMGPRHQRILAVQKALRKSATKQIAWLKKLDEEGLPYQLVDRFWLINAVRLKTTAAGIAFIESLADVARVESVKEHPVELVRPVSMEKGKAKSPGGVEPGIRAIKADSLWMMGYTGKGAKLLTFDTGVWPAHPVFRDRFLGWHVPLEQAWFGYDSYFPGDKFNSHGTHVTGTCVGLDPNTNDTIGIAWNAYFMATDPIVGSLSDLKTLADILRAYQWALNPDGDTNTTDDMPDVVNNSWGHPYDSGFDAGICGGWISDMFLHLEAQDIMSFQSAGNNGPGAGTVGSPALANGSFVNNFAVGAVNGNTASFPVASFSSRGPTICGGTGSLLIKPEVVAPGVNVRSSVLNNSNLTYEYANYQGTSMASPHVSGLALLLREAFPQASATDIKTAIYQTAKDLGPAGEDNAYGMGMIDAIAAFNWLSGIYTPATPSTGAFDISITGTSFSDPGYLCSDSIEVRFFVKSTSVVDKQKLKFHFGYENGLQFVKTFTSGSLQMEDTVLLIVPKADTAGWNRYFLSIEYLGQEEDRINNTYYINVWQTTRMSLPFREDFEGKHVFESTLYVGNEDKRTTWDSVNTGTATGGSTSAFMRFARYSPRQQQRDYLLSPVFQLDQTNRLYLSFDISYQLKFNGFKDSLIVLVAPGCMAGMWDTVYAKGPDELNSTTKPAVSDWMPQDEADWRNEVIDLSNYKSWPGLMFKIIGSNGKGNNLYVDNINLWDDSGQVAVEEIDPPSSQVILFPNPASGKLNIRLVNGSNAYGYIADLNGRVLQTGLQLKEGRELTIGVEEFPPGVYLLHMFVDEKPVVLRWIKL